MGNDLNKYQMEGTDEQSWSKHVESMRKDVECVFGILKKRFLLLKHPVRLHKPEQIQNAFVTCCVLHNLLLDYDGFDDWELRDRNWEDEIDVEHTKLEEKSKALAQKSQFRSDGFLRSEARRENPGAHGYGEECDDDDGDENKNADPVTSRLQSDLFHERRSILIDHYKHCTKSRSLKLNLR